jgi:hypothetical protein
MPAAIGGGAATGITPILGYRLTPGNPAATALSLNSGKASEGEPVNARGGFVVLPSAKLRVRQTTQITFPQKLIALVLSVKRASALL